MSWVLSEEHLASCKDEAGVLVSVENVGPLTSKIGAKRVATELARLTSVNSLERGFHVVSLTSNVWRVDFFNFSAVLAEELEQKKIHLVTCVVVFEGGFPVRFEIYIVSFYFLQFDLFFVCSKVRSRVFGLFLLDLILSSRVLN
jgi:hypothetical protein